MTFAKPVVEKKSSDAELEAKLMCTAYGCPNRWTVQVGKPLCSAHAWADPKNWAEITARINARRFAHGPAKSAIGLYNIDKDHLGEPFEKDKDEEKKGYSSYYDTKDEF
jgi:hypothetical protein